METLDEWAPVLESVHPKTSVTSKSMFFSDDHIQQQPTSGKEVNQDKLHEDDEEEEEELADEDSSGICGDSYDLDYFETATLPEDSSSLEPVSPTICPSARIPRSRRRTNSSAPLLTPPHDAETLELTEQSKEKQFPDGKDSVGGRRMSSLNNRRRSKNLPPIVHPSAASIFNFDYFKREDAKLMIKNLIVQKI